MRLYPQFGNSLKIVAIIESSSLSSMEVKLAFEPRTDYGGRIDFGAFRFVLYD